MATLLTPPFSHFLDIDPEVGELDSRYAFDVALRYSRRIFEKHLLSENPKGMEFRQFGIEVKRNFAGTQDRTLFRDLDYLRFRGDVSTVFDLNLLLQHGRKKLLRPTKNLLDPSRKRSIDLLNSLNWYPGNIETVKATLGELFPMKDFEHWEQGDWNRFRELYLGLLRENFRR